MATVINRVANGEKKILKRDLANQVAATSCKVYFGATEYNIPVSNHYTTGDPDTVNLYTIFGNNTNIGPAAINKRYECVIQWANTPYEIVGLESSAYEYLPGGVRVPQCHSLSILESTNDHIRFTFTVDGRKDRDNWVMGWALLNIFARNAAGVVYTAANINCRMG